MQWGSAALVVGAQGPLGFGVGSRLGCNGHELAAAVLDCGVLQSGVLALGVEADARADAHVVVDISGADGVGQCLGIGRTRTLVGIGRNQRRFESVDVVGDEVDIGLCV